MTFGVRGVIEGFYDRLWTWDERRRVAERLEELGFDTYVYAPKEDAAQNAGWRTPYAPDEAEQLGSFARRCLELGLSPWLGMRPVGFSYADDQDLAILLDRLRAAVDMGAARILMLADDIPTTLDAASAGRFSRLEEAHLWLVDRVLSAIDVPLAFCPTDYHGSGSPYLERLGAGLPPPVDICWTGGSVCSATIEVAETAAIGRVLGRPPLVWDNYPVNDDGMTSQLHIGPIRGRDAGLDRVTRGVLVNPALQPEATLIPLATWGEYLRDPAAYDPEAAFRRAVDRVAGDAEDAEAVAVIAAAFDRSAVRQGWPQPDPDRLAVALDRMPSLSNRGLAADLGELVGR